MAASKDTGGRGVVEVDELGAGTGTGVELRLEVADVWACARAKRGSRALRGSTVISCESNVAPYELMNSSEDFIQVA